MLTAILSGGDPPRLWAIIDESALHRLSGSPEVMAAQREHLVKMSERPNIVLQVIPDIEGITAAGGRAFTILSFVSEPTVVYLEDIGKRAVPSQARRRGAIHSHVRSFFGVAH